MVKTLAWAGCAVVASLLVTCLAGFIAGVGLSAIVAYFLSNLTYVVIALCVLAVVIKVLSK